MVHFTLSVMLVLTELTPWKAFPPVDITQLNVPVVESMAQIPDDLGGPCVVIDKQSNQICVVEEADETSKKKGYPKAICCREYVFDFHYRITTETVFSNDRYCYLTRLYWTPENPQWREGMVLELEANPESEINYIPDVEFAPNRKHSRDLKTVRQLKAKNLTLVGINSAYVSNDGSIHASRIYSCDTQMCKSGNVFATYASPLLPGPGTYEYVPFSRRWSHLNPVMPPGLEDKPFPECYYLYREDIKFNQVIPYLDTGYTVCALYDPAWPPAQLAGRLLKDLLKFAEAGWIETPESVPASVTDLLRRLAEGTVEAGTSPDLVQAFDRVLDDIRAAFDQNRLAAEARDILTLNLQHLKARLAGG